MLRRLFQHTPKARVRDLVWHSAEARSRYLPDMIDAALADCAVLLLVRHGSELSAFESQLNTHSPMTANDGYAMTDLTRHLVAPGRLGIASVGALRNGQRRALGTRLQVHVCERTMRRQDDEALGKTLQEQWLPELIAFHTALDDALLKPFVASTLHALDALKMDEREPLESGMLSNALRHAQRDLAGRATAR